MLNKVAWLGMAGLLSFGAQAAPRPLFAGHVTRLVNDTLFKETLDEGANREVVIEATPQGHEARIGANLYMEAEGDLIEVRRTPIGRLITVHAQGSPDTLQIVLSGPEGHEKGRLDVKRGVNAQSRTAARIGCGR